MTADKPKRKRGRPLKGDAPMSPAERQRRRRLRLIEAARLGTLVHIYAKRMAYRLDMAEEQIQELKSALQEKGHQAHPGLVLKIDFSIEVLRSNLQLLQQALPPRVSLPRLKRKKGRASLEGHLGRHGGSCSSGGL